MFLKLDLNWAQPNVSFYERTQNTWDMSFQRYLDPDKIASVKSWPVPSSMNQVQSFVGFMSFNRGFIKDFAKIAKPLYQLAQGGVHYQTKTRTKVKYPPFKWGPE